MLKHRFVLTWQMSCKIDITSKDETGQLAAAFKRMQSSLIILMQRAQKQNRGRFLGGFPVDILVHQRLAILSFNSFSNIPDDIDTANISALLE